MAPVDAAKDAGGFAPVRRLVSLSSSFFCRDEDDRVVLQDDVSLWGVARAGIVRDLRRHRRSSGFLYDAGVALPAFTHGLPSGRRGTAQPFRGCGSGEEGQRDEGDGDGPRERGSRGTRRRAVAVSIRARGHDPTIRGRDTDLVPARAGLLVDDIKENGRTFVDRLLIGSKRPISRRYL